MTQEFPMTNFPMRAGTNLTLRASALFGHADLEIGHL
jgi:hypothetical protein